MYKGAITTLANAINNIQITAISSTSDIHTATANLAMTSFGIPLIGKVCQQ